MLTDLSKRLSSDPFLRERVRLLCEEITARPAFIEYREAIAAFMENEEAMELLRAAQKIHEEACDENSFSDQDKRDAISHLMNDDKFKDFLCIQEDLKTTEALFHLYITRTLELGRVPEEDELLPEEGCCHGGTCNCDEDDGCENKNCCCS